jgi:sugar transferase (PEP-CTERM/EpsH1 system associated)
MRICFIAPRFPYPAIKGDSLRVYHQLRALSQEHQITLLTMTEAPVSPAEYEQVASLCERVEVVPLSRWRALWNLGVGMLSRQPMQVRYYRTRTFRRRLAALLAEERFDVIHATLIRMLPYVWQVADVPVVVDLIDSLSLNLEARRLQVGGLKRLAYEVEYRRVRKYERSVVGHFPALVVSSPADQQVLGGDNITVIPNGVDLERFPFRGPAGRDAATLVFTGNMGYHPNEEAVAWFATEVWPLLRGSHPGLRFQVVGTNPSDRVRALAQSAPGIEVVGRVPDVAAYLNRAAVAVCPMRSGSGIQNKVLEAMSAGAPVVATAIANRGVQAAPGRDLLVADTAPAFATSVVRLLDNSATGAALAWAGRNFVEKNFRWEEHARRLSDLYSAVRDTVARPGHRPRRRVAFATPALQGTNS